MSSALYAALPELDAPVLAAIATVEVVSDELSAPDLQRRIGLEADAAWAKGDTVEGEDPRSPLARQRLHGVVFASRAGRDADPHEHVEELLARVQTAAARIGELVREGSAVSRLTVFCRSARPGQSHWLRPEQLLVLAQLGAFVWINAWTC